VAITWLGARLAVEGTIGVGELVAFYGVSAFLVVPVTTATEAAGALSSGMVSARKVCGLLNLRPKLAEPENPVPLPEGLLELQDSESGTTFAAGKLTVIDAGVDAEALAARLARFTEAAEGERVLVGGVEADKIALSELRQRVVYAHNQDLWYSGVLAQQLEPARPSGVGITAALFAADAEDIIDALPNGVEEVIGERGREVSGGQRQRLNLARALAIDADVLLLDEPTSAVDAHTEARITERVARLRRGKTTIVFSQSPLWTYVADEVVSSKVPA
jgi:ABC-type multidrug transport system fused ATPase/permease subunit